MRVKLIIYYVGFIGLILGPSDIPSYARQPVEVYRCPGDPVVYTYKITAQEARERGCRKLEDPAPPETSESNKPTFSEEESISTSTPSADSNKPAYSIRSRDNSSWYLYDPVLISSKIAEQFVPSIFWWVIVYLFSSKYLTPKRFIFFWHVVAVALTSIFGGLIANSTRADVNGPAENLIYSAFLPIIFSYIAFISLPNKSSSTIKNIDTRRSTDKSIEYLEALPPDIKRDVSEKMVQTLKLFNDETSYTTSTQFFYAMMEAKQSCMIRNKLKNNEHPEFAFLQLLEDSSISESSRVKEKSYSWNATKYFILKNLPPGEKNTEGINIIEKINWCTKDKNL